MAFIIKNFTDLMELDPQGDDGYVGLSPEYPWGRVYGGQVVAQGLRAAYHTVDEAFHVHSLHAYFIRGGDSDEPIRYEVDQIRNGRSFMTRRVVALQSGGPILNMSASFQVREEEAEIQEVFVPEGLARPVDLKPESWNTVMEHCRLPDQLAPARSMSWIRILTELGDDSALQACALAYTSDDFPTEAARLSYPIEPPAHGDDDRFMGASLDHAIWFHRPGRNDRWALHDFHGMGLAGARGLAVGQVFDTEGVHMATVAQELLMRRKKG
ncbi:MAG: acyl-CoA thioesterase II [Deltaproteobacteria bacterium]|nr:acyl-CoA thioesterase II [Deltaproteobacteria bacterium]